MAKSSGKSRHVFGLDVPRATAILLVLLSHTWPSSTTGLRWANAFGTFGVEIFFVLSGFLIGGILFRLEDEHRLKTPGDLWQFWRRRWYRTLPNYYLFLGLHIVWRWFLLKGSGHFSVDTIWEATFFLLSYKDYFVFLQNLLHPPDYFFPVSWSLTVEEWFYLLFPLVLWCMVRLVGTSRKARLLAIGVFISAPAILRFIIFLNWTEPSFDPGTPLSMRPADWNEVVRKTAMLRLDTIMYGVAAALMATRCPRLWEKARKLWPIALGAVVVFFLSLVFDAPLSVHSPVQRMVMWPLMSVSIALLFPPLSNWHTREGRVALAVSFVARISYSLYLCHGLVLMVMGTWLGPKSPLSLAEHSITWMIVGWVTSFLVAWAAYRWFEKPVMDLRDRKRRKMQAA